jgi:alpha-ketoglutarate-dependent taurine dioxygenase
LEIRTSSLPGGQALPLVVEPADDAPSLESLLEWVATKQQWLDEQLHQVGAILLRGFPVADEQAFLRLATRISPNLARYLDGNSPRTRLHDAVYTSTEYPARLKITLHSEMSYAANPPRRLFFCCLVAPETDGETPIVDCRKVLNELDPEIVERFARQCVSYVKNMHGQRSGIGKSWQGHFETQDPEVAEEHLRSEDIEFEWRDDGSLWTRRLRPALREHPVTGESVWHNQADLWHISNNPASTQVQMLKHFGTARLPINAYFGDGSAISAVDLAHVREVMWREASVFPWQASDLLILDNYLVAHGRMPFAGPRKIVVTMS